MKEYEKRVVIRPSKPSINIGTCITCRLYNIYYGCNYIQKAQPSSFPCLLWNKWPWWVVHELLQKSCDCTHLWDHNINFFVVYLVYALSHYMSHFLVGMYMLYSLILWGERNNTFVSMFKPENSQIYNLFHGKLVHNIQ